MSRNQAQFRNRERDVCVFGGGPAGMAMAARLIEKGRDIVMLDCCPAERSWGGETFTGAIRGPLSAMGAWARFEQAGHRRGYERDSAWGGEPFAQSSMVHPQGPLWHVDRRRFDEDLRLSVLQRAGDIVLPYQKLDSVTREGEGWRIGVDGGSVRAKFLVDATGRARVLGRRLNAKITVDDHLLGLTAEVPRGTGADVRSMLIEATSFGWWYAAPTPAGHVVALFTDSDLAPSELRRRLRPVAANSAFTHVEKQQRWLAVGDACASHDPLCGWGVHRALSNGLRAGDAIESFLAQGDAGEIEDYQRHCREQYENYLEGLGRRYRMEQRWPTAPFWMRRHRLVWMRRHGLASGQANGVSTISTATLGAAISAVACAKENHHG